MILKLNEKKEHCLKLLLQVCSETQINEFNTYLSNPVKYPGIIDLLKRMKVMVVQKRKCFSQNNYDILCNWLDDELAFSILITQNSKCDPFKYISF